MSTLERVHCVAGSLVGAYPGALVNWNDCDIGSGHTFAVLRLGILQIRTAAPGDAYGDVIPWDVNLFWELERRGQVWDSCHSRWRYLRGAA